MMHTRGPHAGPGLRAIQGLSCYTPSVKLPPSPGADYALLRYPANGPLPLPRSHVAQGMVPGIQGQVPGFRPGTENPLIPLPPNSGTAGLRL